MKARTGVLVALASLLALGAAYSADSTPPCVATAEQGAVSATKAGTAQVSREEFEALQAETRALKAQVVMLDIRVKALEKRAAAPGPAAAGVGVIIPPVAPGERAKPLEGQDLEAWKVAREAVKEELDQWNARALRLVGPGQDLDEGKPTTAYMERTPTGDYVFSFGSRWRDKGNLRAVYRVRVRVYAGELRANAAEIDRAWGEEAARYWAALAARP